MVYLLNKDDFLCTIDIKNAYLHLEDRHKKGLCIHLQEGGNYSYFLDNRLRMGLSSSPYIFSRISDLLVRCAYRVRRVVNYLDDFCILSHTKSSAFSD